MHDDLHRQASSGHYFQQEYDDLPRFISYFYQVDLVRSLQPRSVLEIGVGNKTVANYLRQNGIETSTCDIDAALQPDYVADVRKLPFPDDSYDVVMACEVLEHLPWSDLEWALRELHRTTRRFVLLSLPHASAALEIVLRNPLPPRMLKTPFFGVSVRMPLFFTRTASTGEHHWEIGRRSFPARRIRAALRNHFTIRREVRPALHSYHHFFVLEKR
ncbi:hypothetical protein BH23GEM7_BH23GEM7_23540 [soil metagenome]